MVESRFVETERLGVVIYDVPILNTDGEALCDEIQARTEGNISTIVVSHGHPDHWGSLDFFQKRVPGVSILAAKETAFYMECTGEPNLRLSREWQPELLGIPERVVMPTELFEGRR